MLSISRRTCAINNGTLASTIGSILADLKPETAYFVEDNGSRAGFIFLNLANSSQIPAIAEPWFLAFNAKVELRAALNLEDLKNAGPGIESAVRKYARTSKAAGA